MLSGSATAQEEAPKGSAPKTPSLVPGLDEVLDGGLPSGRVTLLCGGPGCGKTLLALTFVARAGAQTGEPGLFVSFGEKRDELLQTAGLLGCDLERLMSDKKFLLDAIRIDRRELVTTGEYDLGGLFARIGHAIDRIGAQRVALDSLDNLFGCFADASILRGELQRRRHALEARRVALEAQLHAAAEEEQALLDQEAGRDRAAALQRSRIAASRHGPDSQSEAAGER